MAPFVVIVLIVWAALDVAYLHPLLVALVVVGLPTIAVLRARRRDRLAALERARVRRAEHIATLELLLL